MKSILSFLLFTFCAYLNSSQTLKLASGEIERLDPRKLSTVHAIHVFRSLYERLVRFEPDGKIHPAIAKAIEVSNGKKTYTFHLRDSFWSDGSPLIAKEFVDAWKESIASKALYVKNWFCVKNGKQVVNGEVPFDQLGVTSPDEKTIIIELEKPTTYFLELMEDVSCSPIKEGVDLNFPEWASEPDENYICNGPFRIQNNRGNQIFLLEKNPFYWDVDSVQLEKMQIVFIDNTELLVDLFEFGKIDWIGAPHFQSISNFDIIKRNYPLFSPQPAGVSVLSYNVTQYPLTDVNLRKALAYSINRKQICQYRNSNDIPAPSILLPKYNCQNYFSEDEELKKAQFYFSEFLRKNNQTPSSVSFTITGTTVAQTLLERLQEQWKKNFGISIDIEIREAKKMGSDLNKGNFQITLGAFIGGRYNDPTELFQHFLSDVPKNNLAYWSNPAFIRLVNLAEEQTHSAIRSKLLAWAEEIIMDQLPLVPLFYYGGCYAKNPRLQNEFLMHSGHVDFRWAFFSESA